MNEKEFGDKIKARREELGLSQKDLANALNTDQGKISLIERGGRKIDCINELPTLSRVLKKPISWFFEDTESVQEENPVQALISQYFPDVNFTEFEMKRIAQFLEPVMENYIKQDPQLGKRIINS